MRFVRLLSQQHKCVAINCYSTKSEAVQFTPHKYCVNLVRSNDHENFLATLLIKGDPQKRAAIALRAFNVEVAKAAGSVSDDRIALMKLRFWSDAVNQLYAKDADKRLPDHPVVHEVNNVIKAIAQFRLPKMYLQRLIQSRQRASNAVFSTTEELEQHVEQSTSSVYYLLLRITGVDDLNADHAASHLGKAQGISNLLRTLATMSNQASGTSRMAVPPIPQDILLKHNCSYERILRQQVDDLDTQNCVYDVASVASVHLTKARKLSDKLNANARCVLLPAVAIDRFLDRLRLCHFHLYDRRLARSDGLLPLVYFWNRWRGRY